MLTDLDGKPLQLNKGKRERDHEADLVAAVHRRGGHAYKFTSPGRRNVPDRFCILPGGILFFVECKRPGEDLSKGQEREAERLLALGARVFVYYGEQPADEFLNTILKLIFPGAAK